MIKEIENFDKKLIRVFREDIKRILEVTCYSSGPKNHGSNFIAILAILVSIETLSQFTNEKSEEELRHFKESAKGKYKILDKETRKFLFPRSAPENSSGSHLSLSFIQQYFDPIFSEKIFKEESLADIIWKYRNPQAHGYYPFISNELRGAVDWLFDPVNERKGVRIDKIKKEFHRYKKYLWQINNGWFRLCPQILFVYFEFAIDKYLEDLRTNEKSKNIFIKNYKRLAKQYCFE